MRAALSASDLLRVVSVSCVLAVSIAQRMSSKRHRVVQCAAPQPPSIEMGEHTLTSICFVRPVLPPPPSPPALPPALRALPVRPALAPYGLNLAAVFVDSEAVRSRSPSLSTRAPAVPAPWPWPCEPEIEPPALCRPPAPRELRPRRAADICVLYSPIVDPLLRPCPGYFSGPELRPRRSRLARTLTAVRRTSARSEREVQAIERCL